MQTRRARYHEEINVIMLFMFTIIYTIEVHCWMIVFQP